jgi:branched-chain amino acid transport system substrate-binding protein
MSRVRASAVVAAALLTAAVAACGSDSGAGAGGGNGPLKIGLAVDLTGLYAFAGVPNKQGAEVALEEINAAGGINGRRLELVNGDAASDQQQTKTLITKYAADKSVIAALGPTGSAVAPAVAPVIKSLKLPTVAPTVVTPLLTTDNPYAFKLGANPDGVGLKLCDLVKSHGYKRVAIMFTRDNAGQVGYKDTTLKCLPQVGAQIVTQQSAADSTDDYSSFISNIKSKNPDAIFTLLSGNRAAQFEVQARGAGIPASVQFFGPNTVTGADFLKIGKTAVEGTIGVTEYSPSMPTDVNKTFVAAYNKRFGIDPDNYAAQGYAAMQLVAAGLKAAGPDVDRESLRAALSKVNGEPTVMGLGKLTVDPDHAPQYGLVTVQVQNGKLALYEQDAS